jgi:hypothetical protein
MLSLVLRPAVLRTAIASLARGKMLFLQMIVFPKPWHISAIKH